MSQGNAWIWAAGGVAALVLLGGGAAVTYRHFKQRGIRNNNPGNLVKTAIAWKGKVPHELNTDSRFEQFQDTAGTPGHIWGIRAMFMDIRSDIRKGLVTVRKLITEYAPAHENNTAAYIAAVSGALGIGPDAPIAPGHYPALVAAIIKHENGVQPYPAADIAQAIRLAG